MLSRAAERVYWTGRYLERAENTARIVQQYAQLLLDLPDEVGVSWDELVHVVGAGQSFAASGRGDNESDVLRFLLADMEGGASLAYSLRMARESIRNTRDLLPHESWENINELYRYGQQRLAAAAEGDNQFEMLAECIARCQQINGILTATMSHRSPYRFLRLGQNIERADMTSRIIDVAAAYISKNERLVQLYGSSLWTNVLKSVSGFQMYRQYCQPQVEGFRVINFLLGDEDFPRSISCCVDRARGSAEKLPRGEATRLALDAVSELFEYTTAGMLSAADVRKLMDDIQLQLGDAHQAVVATWFLPDDDS